MTVIGVALAGAIGALARYGLGAFVSHRATTEFPLGTFLINITGSFVIGLLFVLFTERFVGHESLRITLMIGFVGSYTTFSTFSLETIRLFEEGAAGIAVAYVAASLIAGLLATWAGIAIARAA